MVKFLQGLSDELSLYVRHCAWLNTAPDKPETDKSKKTEPTRRKRFGEDLEMPPCDADYMVAYLFEIGPVIGDGPISHAEIEAWQRNTGICLNSWEARTVKRMSLEYFDESRQATDRARPAPWQDAPYLHKSASSVGTSLRDEMRALAQL